MPSLRDPVEKQRSYYAKMAAVYNDAFAFDPEDEHFIACSILTGLASHYQLHTLLDVGCGTGRAINYLSESSASLEILGVEPVKEMRDAAVGSGIPADRILDGDITALSFADAHFDCCTAFGVLHHVPNPDRAIREMFRVSRKAVFISDHNVYGMGSPTTRMMKQLFRDLHARWLLRLLLTGGKGYHDTDWDGVFYPFSLIDQLDLIRSLARKIYLFPTRKQGLNLYRQASHLAVLALI
jgi:ubiquinone/menaquinone biosynthesis C-methylase UbiE